MADKARGLGLMKICKIDRPVTITVGDIIVTLVKVGTQNATIAVKAPPEIAIQFSDGASLHETVEQALQSVLQGKH